MYLYRDHQASTSLWKGEGLDKESKKVMPSLKFFHVLFAVTKSFLLVFSWSPDNITAGNK